MYDDIQVDGIIVPGVEGDQVAGVIVHDADDDELAEAALDQVVGAEPPPETPG